MPCCLTVARPQRAAKPPVPVADVGVALDTGTGSGTRPVWQSPLQDGLSQRLRGQFCGQRSYSSARRRSLLNRSVTDNMATANPSWTNINP